MPWDARSQQSGASMREWPMGREETPRIRGVTSPGNRMTRRLAITIAIYIERFHVWPREVRLSASALYYIANGMRVEEFERLAGRLRMRVTKHAEIAVGGPEGHLTYEQKDVPSEATINGVEHELDLASR